ncbi:hypothetical protein CC78DRAFT_585468 [Lojkania enalia]|uniref:Nephrocystin 3-like N-terminal domain-containing protein n=1 Tax=Lojkania enalia TaxID=147567 RepID=A0A9P4K494_9PLEO|nr:hypothetical protein CC78DRAFT_585468 [Didymosphaeria enalia]
MADKMFRTANEGEFLECLQWLSPVPVPHHHEMHSSNRIASTREWLLNHPKFWAWNDSSDSSILKLHGIPGCGKSSIASAIVDDFISDKSGSIPLAYFYCARNTFEIEHSSPTDIMGSLVRQLTISKNHPSKIHDTIFGVYEQKILEAKLTGFDIVRLKLEKCMDLIIEFNKSSPITMVIDAVDEVARDGRPTLLNSLKQLTKRSANATKVFLTTRTDSQILAYVEKDLATAVDRNIVRSDIEKVPHHLLAQAINEKKLLKGHISEELRLKLENSLIESAGEMFLAVTIQLKTLCSQKTEYEIDSVMDQLPPTYLDEMYAKMYNDILQMDSRTRDIAFNTFSILLCAQEPLSPKVPVAASCVVIETCLYSLEIDALVDICFSLILVDSKLDAVRFAHLSVQEFLEAKPEFQYQLNHERIAHICLKVCSGTCPTSGDVILGMQENIYQYCGERRILSQGGR